MEDYLSKPVAEPLLGGTDTQPFSMELISDVETSGEPLYTLTAEGGYLTAVFDRGEPEDPYYNSVEGKTVELAGIKVYAKFTGQGLATELLRTMAQEMAARGAVELDMDVVNPIVMQILVRIFGQSKLAIYERSAGEAPLPIETAQAIASIERGNTRAEQREELGMQHPPEFYYGLRVKIDLTDPEIIGHLSQTHE